MSRLAAVACLVVVPSMVLGQQGSLDFGRWRNFTDMKAVRGIAASGDSVWVVTAGGLFLFVPSANQYAKFTNSEGLSSNDLTAVTRDGSGRVWTGASDGAIDLYDPATRAWRDIQAIKNSDRIQKGIRNFLEQGDSLFIATDYGVSVLMMSRFEFRDTYATFGFPTQTRVNDLLIHKGRIWAATDLGVVSAALSASNLSSPTFWTRYEVADGLPAKGACAIVAFRDTVFVGTANGIAFFDGNAFRPVTSTGGKAVVDMLARTNDLLVAWNDPSGFTVGALSGALGVLSVLALNSQTSATTLALQISASSFWLGTPTKGLARWTGTTWRYNVPNGPQSNLFSSIVIDENGALWGASGISGRGLGFYRYDASAPESEQWKNYTTADYPAMAGDDYYKVSLGANGSVWASSWGRGLVEVVDDSIKRRLDHTTQPALAGSVPQDPSYVVIGGVAVDSKANTWIVDRGAINGNHLVQLSSDNSAKYRSGPLESQGIFSNVIVDRYNTKWLANSEPSHKLASGLFYFNEDTLVSGTRFTGGWGSMTQTDGLPANTNNIILSLAVDLDGDVCVGTDIGMMIINEPRNPKATSSRMASFPLRGQSIQAIAVDAVNNKWVGTKEGVIVVSPDGVQLLAQYSVLSTGGKLMDDDVRSIAIDQKRGIVYFGTEKGLSSLEIMPVQAARSLSSLEIGPNPFLIPGGQQLTIRGLVQESMVKILAADGTLVTEFRTQGGGRAFWNGRDKKGELVPSGVYVIVAYADNGDQVTTGKVAVVRR